MKILFYNGFAAKEWRPGILDQEGIGGSQVATINVAKNLALMGHEVFATGDVIDCVDSGVTYIGRKSPKFDTILEQEYDVLVILRYHHCLVDFNFKAKKTYLWLQDTTFQPWSINGRLPNDGVDLFLDNLCNLDGVILVSDWHKNYFLEKYPQAANKARVIGNGISLELFPPIAKKRKNSFLFSSRPERGLTRTLKIFTLIKQSLPDAELHICTYLGLDAASEQQVNSVDGAYYYGSLSQKELHREMMLTDVWLYPTGFTETSCITAIEMQYAGAVCICTALAGLLNTVDDRGLMLNKSASDEEISAAVVGLLSDEKRKAELVNKAQIWAKTQTWENKAMEWEQMFNEQKVKKNICLNMIVKNESKVIRRLLESVKDSVDYYVIVDTGSTDGTPEIIKSTMDAYGIEGEVHHEPWVNFGHNRQQALEYAVAAGKADFLLFIDADEELKCSERFYENLDLDTTYYLEKHHSSYRYAAPALINIKNAKWAWKGVVHNYLQSSHKLKVKTLKNAWIIYHTGQGAKSHGVTPEQKFLRDAAMLEEELKKNPKDSRSQYYLAQSYRDAGKIDLAIENYKKNIELKGWTEEIYVSYLRIGEMMRDRGDRFEDWSGWFLKAYDYRPTRLEALYNLVSYCRKNKMHFTGWNLGHLAEHTPYPSEDRLLVLPKIYDWMFLDELSLCAYWSGAYQNCFNMCQRLLDSGNLDEGTAKRVKENQKHAADKLNAAVHTNDKVTAM